MRRFPVTWVWILALIPISGTFAQNPDYSLSLRNAVISTCDSTDLTVILDSTGDDIQGWSYGVCHNSGQLSLDAVATGSTTQTVHGGSPPDFEELNLFSNGFAQAVVVDFSEVQALGISARRAAIAAPSRRRDRDNRAEAQRRRGAGATFRT